LNPHGFCKNGLKRSPEKPQQQGFKKTIGSTHYQDLRKTKDLRTAGLQVAQKLAASAADWSFYSTNKPRMQALF
jgi:hypothetical protein